MRIFPIIFIVLVFSTTSLSQNLESNCIGIIGDSVPRGTSVAQINGYGFAPIETRSFSLVLDELLNQEGISHLAVYDFSVEASTLNDGGRIAYRNQDAYRLLQAS